MTDRCERLESGAIELYFYGELPASEQLQVEQHFGNCGACRALLDDLSTVGGALAGRPIIGAPADGDWSGFMTRLRDAVDRDAVRRGPYAEAAIERDGDSASRARCWPAPPTVGRAATSLPLSRSGLVAAAAVLALALAGVMFAMRSRGPAAPAIGAAARSVPSGGERGEQEGFEALSEEHLQRSKLVVLGLAAKNPARATAADWMYERELAATLLSDTRMYRMAAEERGLRPIAEVMRDLEVVLLQASFTDVRDPSSLVQIQRLIRQRDLVGKMDIVAISGL